MAVLFGLQDSLCEETVQYLHNEESCFENFTNSGILIHLFTQNTLNGSVHYMLGCAERKISRLGEQ